MKYQMIIESPYMNDYPTEYNLFYITITEDEYVISCLGHYHLWSEIGGFIGIFLGFGLMQVFNHFQYIEITIKTHVMLCL